MTELSFILGLIVGSLWLALFSIVGVIARGKSDDFLDRRVGERGVTYLLRLAVFFLFYWIIALPAIVRSAVSIALIPLRWLFTPKEQSSN